jgi:hypothetical protein
MALGQYAIDGQDWYGVYGFVVQKVKGKGKDAFLKFFDTKTPTSHDWQDENGVEYDLSERFYKEKEVLIDGILTADTIDQFWQRHTAMQLLFGLPGTRRMYVNSLKRSFYVFYDSCTDFGTLTPLNNEYQGKIGCSYSFKFIEANPSLWHQFLYLVDKDGNNLIDNSGNKLTA